MLALAVMLSLDPGCAHERVPPHPEPTPEVAEIAVRRDQEALRRRVQLLEDRVVRLEQSGRPPTPRAGTEDAPPARRRLDADPDPDPDPARGAGATMPHGGISLAEAPARGRPAVTLGPTPDASTDVMALWDEPQAPPAHASAPVPADTTDAHSTGRYRLVGSRLVELTRERGPAGPDRKERGPRGRSIEAEYQEALDLHRTGEHAAAEAAFAAFAAAYPRSDYADNALYWQGEAAYDQSHFRDALAAFTDVVERYGGGNKAPDALLKIGLCYDKLGDLANARDVLLGLVAAYPGVPASDIARARLAELEVQDDV